jgi:hypothetical protein
MNQLPQPIKALEDYKQFVLYKLVPKPNGKNDKLPLNPSTGMLSNAHDASIWMTAKDAFVHLEKFKAPDIGLGFVFTAADPWFFVDIDGCIVDGEYSDIAKDLLSMLPGAAVEISSSGKGLHIFGYGTPPEHACKNTTLDLELYHQDRFVAFGDLSNLTGEIFQDFTSYLPPLVAKYFVPSIAYNDADWTTTPSAEWYGPEDDDELINKMCKTRSAKSAFGGGANFKDLWTRNVGVLSTSYPTDTEGAEFDGSSADAALAQHLAFWTGNNCDRMHRLMLKSALVRDKWTKHKRYLGLTVSGAKTKQKTVHQGKRPVEVLPEPITPPSISVVDTAGHQCEHVGFVDLKGNGKPKGTLPNFKRLVDHFGITLRYNMMSRDPEVSITNEIISDDGVNNDSLTALRSLAIAVEFPVADIDAFVSRQSKRSAYHPAMQWIETKKWDGVDRLGALVATLQSTNVELTTILIRKWCINAIRHLYDTNPKSSGILVLQGSQNAGKTRWLMNLVGPVPTLAKEGVTLNPNDKDSLRQTIDKWIVELGELDATFRKADVAALKSFITRDYDEFRAPFERKQERYVRRTALCASVNDEEYLKDPTGNRRYWTVSVGDTMQPDHDVDMQQLWAQMKSLKESGSEVHWLRDEEAAMLADHNTIFTSIDPHLELLHKAYDMGRVVTREMTTTEILTEIGQDPKDARRWSTTLRKFIGTRPRRAARGNIYDMPDLLNPFMAGRG